MFSFFDNRLQIHIVHLGAKQHDTPELVTKSHYQILEPLLGRYIYYNVDAIEILRILMRVYVFSSFIFCDIAKKQPRIL